MNVTYVCKEKCETETHVKLYFKHNPPVWRGFVFTSLSVRVTCCIDARSHLSRIFNSRLPRICCSKLTYRTSVDIM